MSFKDIAKEIDNYKKVYLEGVNKRDQIINSTELTQHAKDTKVADIESRYQAVIDTAGAKVIETVEATKEELRRARLKSIEDGLSEAEKILAISDGINKGAYNVDMIKDIVEVYKDNPPVVEAIRGAVISSDDEKVRELANEIPKDTTNETLAKLDKVIEKIEIAPKLNAKMHGDNWGSQLWQNGAGIDSLATFVLGLEDIA